MLTDSPTPVRRLAAARRRLPWLALGGLLWAACFDQPVEERLRLSFLGDGQLSLQLSLSLRFPQGLSASEPLARRLRQLEERLLTGTDPWSARFAEIEAAAESLYWEKQEGHLARYERDAVLEDPEAFVDFLADTPIHSTYRRADGIAEVALYPGVSDRATRRERRQVEETLAEWSELLAIYFEAAEDLYRYLEARPRRAVPCFAGLFEEETPEGAVALTPEEEELVEALGNAMGEAVGVLTLDPEAATSLEEISRRVYDPFPARFELQIPGDALESEGFAAAGDLWIVPGLSLWSAFRRLEGRWLAPDPMSAYVHHYQSGDDTPFDVRGFAADRRLAEPAPGADEVLAALREWLEPATVYRVAWQLENPQPEEMDTP